MPKYFTILAKATPVADLLETARACPFVQSTSLNQGEPQAVIVRGRDGRTITLNVLRHDEPGDRFSKLKLGIFDYFYRVVTRYERAKATALEHLEHFDTAIGVVLDPDSMDQEDWRFDLVFSVAEATRGLIFNGSDLIGWDGRLLLSKDGDCECG